MSLWWSVLSRVRVIADPAGAVASQLALTSGGFRVELRVACRPPARTDVVVVLVAGLGALVTS